MNALGITGRLHVCGNTSGILPLTSTLGAKVVDVDHLVDFDQALNIAQARCLLNGNIDPVADVYTCDAAHTKQAMLDVAKKANGRRALFMPVDGTKVSVDYELKQITNGYLSQDVGLRKWRACLPGAG